MQQHVLDDHIGALAVLYDLVISGTLMAMTMGLALKAINKDTVGKASGVRCQSGWRAAGCGKGVRRRAPTPIAWSGLGEVI
jgi:hypothetical protein